MQKIKRIGIYMRLLKHTMIPSRATITSTSVYVCVCDIRSLIKYIFKNIFQEMRNKSFFFFFQNST